MTTDPPRPPDDAAASPDGGPPTPSRPFDEEVCDRIRAAFQDVFLRHPEVKCLAASITWQGALNDARILHGVWLGPDGPVVEPDGVIASIHQTLKMLDEQTARGLALVAHLQDQVRVLGSEVVARHEQLRKLEEEVRRRQGRRDDDVPEGATDAA